MMEENVAPALSEVEQRYVERARRDNFADGGIVRYYEQARALRASETVLEAIELRMRTDFPAEARKVFGAKGATAEDMLARTQQDVRSRFVLSNNRRGNHVMVGGDERRTEVYLSRYIAYRDKREKDGAMLALVQARPEAELRVLVRSDRVHSPGAEPLEQWFATGDFALAQQAYIELLLRLGAPPAVATAD